jgi:hypothetical protein
VASTEKGHTGVDFMLKAAEAIKGFKHRSDQLVFDLMIFEKRIF